MDYYKILGLSTSATLGQIKKAFHRLAREFHPDKNPNNPIAEDKFQRVSEAYAVLSNPFKRAKYDRSYTAAQDRAEQRSSKESQQSFTRTKPTSKTNNESPTPAAHSKEITWKKDGAKMVLIPKSIPESIARTKDMYNEFGDIVSGEVVSGEVVKAFYMDTTEVTVGQFKKFLKSFGYKPEKPIDWAKLYEYSPTDDHPMIYVSWFDATAYCEWASKRLPTEKEWEFAARGGLKNKEFPWGNDESVAEDYANCQGERRWANTNEWEYCAPVGSYPANGYGLYDMAGNVNEWCSDWYDEDKYYRVLRGGSWGNHPYAMCVAYRNYGLPSETLNDYGFRCVSGF